MRALRRLAEGRASSCFILPPTDLACARVGLATAAAADRPERPAGAVQRFYKTVRVEEAQDGFAVLLDARPIKTPARLPLVLPTRALALAVAAEWEWQRGRVAPHTMPLMALAATALDEPKPAAAVVATLLRFLPTDAVLVRDEAGPVAAAQAAALDPVLAWARAELGLAASPSASIFGAAVPPADAAAVRARLEGLGRWRLAAAAQLAAACRSVLLALAAAAGRLGVAETLAAARVEEDWQAERWGAVEGGHDVDAADLRVRIAAVAVFLRLLRPR